MTKLLVVLLVLALAVPSLALAADKIKIGASFSDFEVERWPVEAELMKKLAAEQGAEVVVQAANHDAKLQNDQIENMVLQGVDVIIIIAEDGAAAASAVNQAAQDGIPCIAYDRLIKSTLFTPYFHHSGRFQYAGSAKSEAFSAPDIRQSQYLPYADS